MTPVAPFALRPRRRARAVALAAALLGLVGGLLVATTVTANAAVTLLSQGRPATASSTENAGTPASRRGRRQHRHPLVERVQRSTVDPGRPRRHRHHHPGRAQLGGRLRHRVPDPDLGERHHLDQHLLHHHEHRRRADAHRHRHRPVRAR